MGRQRQLCLWGLLGAVAVIVWSTRTKPSKEAHDLAAAEFYLAINRPRRSSLRASLHFDSSTCTGFVRIVDAAAVSPPEVTEFDHFGPDSFHIRVAGPEILAVAVDAVRHLGLGVYVSDPFTLRRPGKYSVQLWHLYENFTALTMAGERYPAPLPEYMRLHGSGQGSAGGNSTLWPPSHTGNIQCHTPRRHTLAAAAQPCGVGKHVPGRWVHADGVDGRDHSAFEAMQYADVQHSHMLQYEPDDCALSKLDSAQSLRCLGAGGVGTGRRAARRSIAIVGDSHFRILANGFYFALGNSPEFNHTRYHHHDARVYLPKTDYGGAVTVEYCEVQRLHDDELAHCGPALLPGPDDVLVAGSGAWPLCTAGGWPVMLPEEYRARLEAFREVWTRWQAQHHGRRVLWLTIPAPTMYYHVALRDRADHRSISRHWLYNQIAKDVFAGSAVGVIDVLPLSLPVNNLSWDRGHYDSAVLRETVNLIVHACCAAAL